MVVKRKIRVNFVDFYNGFNKMENDFMAILQRHFEVELSEEPEYLFYSVFGTSHIHYDCIKIFYTGECVVPNFNLCDYAIGFEYLQFGDRYIRVPLYQLFQYKKSLELALQKDGHPTKDREFCSFVVSNDQGMPERKRMFELLSQYKHVDSGGRYLNNIGGRVADKLAFDRKHKFSIVFENCVSKGYTTEKIVEAFAAGTIPIYFGDPAIEAVFNPKAFINCQHYASLEDVVDRVIEIDNNDELYNSICSEPVFLDGVPTQCELENFLVHIVEQPLKEARRRPYNTNICTEERNARIAGTYQKYIGHFEGRVNALIRKLRNGVLLK